MPWDQITFAEWIQIIIGIASLIATILVSFLIYWLQSRHEKEMERIQVRTAQKELENRASQFLIDNESERAYLPWCVIASRLDRHGHHTRQIYTNFCRCSDELQTEIFKQANLSKDGHAYAEEIPKWVELLRTDILNLQLGFDVLYDGAKYFHRSFLRYRDNCWDSTTKAKIFNSIADHTYMLIGRFSECNQLDLLSYIDEYFYYFLASDQGATMEISPLPPVDYVWSNQNLGYADESTVCMWVMELISGICMIKHNRRIQEEKIVSAYPNYTDVFPQTFEDKYYQTIQWLGYTYSKYAEEI